MYITVGICSLGRKAVLLETVKELLKQRRPFDKLLICLASEGDGDRCLLESMGAEVLISPTAGSCVQRNMIIDKSEHGILLFIDDDYYLRSDYLEELERIFALDESVCVVTGNVLVDGAKGPGLPPEYARLVLEHSLQIEYPEMLKDCVSGYGCNMAVLIEQVRQIGARFDERLPLYGWLEDLDFSRQFLKAGRLVRSERLVGVHLGTKISRSSGLRLGYSQVMNPWYLRRKGTVSWWVAIKHICLRLAGNYIYSHTKGDILINRKERLRGNIIALCKLAKGEVDPEYILKL